MCYIRHMWTFPLAIEIYVTKWAHFELINDQKDTPIQYSIHSNTDLWLFQNLN